MIGSGTGGQVMTSSLVSGKMIMFFRAGSKMWMTLRVSGALFKLCMFAVFCSLEVKSAVALSCLIVCLDFEFHDLPDWKHDRR